MKRLKLKKRLLALAAICLSGSLLGCDSLPPFPTVEVRLVDVKHDKLHVYNLPKKRGDNAEFLGSIPLATRTINKNFCISPSNYSKLEQYISAIEDLAARRCR